MSSSLVPPTIWYCKGILETFCWKVQNTLFFFCEIPFRLAGVNIPSYPVRTRKKDLPDRLSLKADLPSPVNLVYDSEILICNQNFPCYLILIDAEKSVTYFFTEKKNRLLPHMTIEKVRKLLIWTHKYKRRIHIRFFTASELRKTGNEEILRKQAFASNNFALESMSRNDFSQIINESLDEYDIFCRTVSLIEKWFWAWREK